MKKKILITSFDLAIGGVERSLIGLLQQIDYEQYDVDLLLFRHEGELLAFLPEGPQLLQEVPSYATFRKSIKQIAQEGYIPIAIARLLAKSFSTLYGKLKKMDEPGYLTIQYGWEWTNAFLPWVEHTYDVALSFLWPHHFIGQKVKAKKKIGWIHTDYSHIHINKTLEKRMWNRLDDIVAVSEECANTFLQQYPDYKANITVIENILSPVMIKAKALAAIPDEIKGVPGKTILLTVARLSHAKGIDQAIYACRKLINQGYKLEWYAVGYGPLAEELQQLIHTLGLEKHFFLLGKKVNPYPYIRACDLYVQPSRYEGKAVTIREAQILEKPVVLTDFPTAKSQAQHGIDGWVTPLSIEGIVDGIKRLIDDQDLRERLIDNTIQTDYGNETEIEKLYQLIEE
ncbi:glycosyltransferase [Bacillus sp. SD088]|uniref:glycosyltransferase n=1 Tax=Bacillus sp. SD088 TaxID=2782012 RepID=UPI001A96C8E8|nr:glycosyltransferase [Bacillus sp. SD088]MBO0992534.1 glycosyltransferase [Bacillus sp. SD088]